VFHRLEKRAVRSKSLRLLYRTSKWNIISFSSVQFSHSVMSGSLRPHESQHARPPCPSPTPGVHSHTSIESVMPSSHLILCCPLLLLPPIPPSIRVFSNESTLRMKWPKYWSFSFSIIPSKEIPGPYMFLLCQLLSFDPTLFEKLLWCLLSLSELRITFILWPCPHWESLKGRVPFFCQLLTALHSLNNKTQRKP